MKNLVFILFFLFALLFSAFANAADQILCTEISTDPLGRNYASMTDIEIADSLNTEDRTRIRDTMTGQEIFQAIDVAELRALSTADQLLVINVTNFEIVNPTGNEAALFIAIFGGGSATITELLIIRVETISRAVEIGVAKIPVKEAHVAECV